MHAITVIPLTVGQMQENCYIVACRDTHECLIIDPGDDATYIAEKILEYNVTPKMILATHGHFDHVLAALELQLVFSIPFAMHQKDIFLLDRMKETAAYFLKHPIAEMKPSVSKMVKQDDSIMIGKSSLRVVETPGHTPGSICLYSASDSIVFVGDLLFAGGGVGRTDHTYGRPLELHNSVKKILKLPPQTILYPGHGESTTVQDEIVYHRSQ